MAPSSFTRRSVLAAGGSGLALLLAACSTGPAVSASSSAAGGSASASGSGAPAAFPRTIEHVYGTTEVTATPTRVATVSWVNQDVVLALGVVPVGMAAVEFGGNADKSTDWFDAKLAETPGAERPVTWSEASGIDAEAIAAARPDLIVAAYSGITREDYDRLAKIAPTIAYPQDTPAFGTPWQETTRLIGTALGKDAEAEALVKDLEGKIADAAAKHTALKDATFIYGTVDPSAADQISLYTLADNRPRFLESLGMKQAPVVTENSPADQAFFFTWSPERADELESDVLVSWALDDSAAEKIAADPLLSRIPAVAKDALVLQTDQQQVLSVSAISPLSIPYALEHLVPPIADAAARAKKA